MIPSSYMLRAVRKLLGRYWLLVPIFISLGTQCDESPRGNNPTPIISVELRYQSVPSPPLDDSLEVGSLEWNLAFGFCFARMQKVNHVEPSWRGNTVTLFTEASPNVFTVSFNDVPIGATNTVSIHDENECRRDPDGQGHVTDGVSINGQPLRRIVGEKALAFKVTADGLIEQ